MWKPTSQTHVAAGYLAGLISSIMPAASIIMATLFIIYEFWEDRIKHDRDYVSIAEYLAGYYAGAYTYLAMEALHPSFPH